MWTFDRSSQKYISEMVYQTMHCENQKISKALRKETVYCIMKNSNVRQYPITCDTLLIADADTKVKRRAPKLLLEYSMHSCTMSSLLHQMMEV